MSGSFYCEACGAEVKSGASACPSCGRRFLGVRCPRCGREGRSEEFSNGCPDCGYMAEKAIPVRPAGDGGGLSGGNGSGTSGRGTRVRGGAKETGRKKNVFRTDWPASRYWALSILVVLGLAAALFFWIRG